MKIKTNADRIVWRSDNYDLYLSGTHMIQLNTYQISLLRINTSYDEYGNEVVYLEHKASFFAPKRSLYTRLNELIARRPEKYGYRYN